MPSHWTVTVKPSTSKLAPLVSQAVVAFSFTMAHSSPESAANQARAPWMLSAGTWCWTLVTVTR